MKMACTIEPSAIVQSNSGILGIPSAESLTLRVGPPRSIEVRSNELSKAENGASVQLIPHFDEFIAFLLSCDLPEVRSVFMGQDGRLLQVFIVVDEYNFEINERIYDREECVMDVFDRFDFDFHITCQHQMSDESLKRVL